MIASYLHNYIFIKPKKVGGTTVEAVLSASCGPEDIITPLGAADEAERSRGGPPVCRNFAEPHLEGLWRDALARGDLATLDGMKGKRREARFFAHMKPLQIRQKLDKGFWRQARKISLVRHPYEKAVSMAFFKYGPEKGPFADFLDVTVGEGKYASEEYYTINGRVVIDDFFRCESLHSDLSRLADSLGIPMPDALPRLKSNWRTDPRPALEILSRRQKEIVVQFCAWEFEQFGYPP